MMRRVPIVSTLVVLAAAATMVALGFWQLDRKQQKEALLARYANAQALSADVPFPRSPEEVEGALYRHSSLACRKVLARKAIAGRGVDGESGFAQIVTCALDGGGEAEVALGLTRSPDLVSWSGGTVTGFVGHAGSGAARLVAAPAAAGLDPLAPPDPADIPNNHLAYAVQWFFFAATALVIYGLALRKRWRTEPRG